MTDTTSLDTFHAHMVADQEDDAARLSFYGALADTELFVLLTHEATNDNISPEILELEGDKFALVFDREERLVAFSKTTAAYAALPGRVIAGMFAGQNIGLGLNLGVAPSSILIPAEAMEWLTQALAESPVLEMSGKSGTITAIDDNLKVLLPILTEKLKFAGGHITAAFLAGSGGGEEHAKTALLGCFDVPDTAHASIARAAQEALTFSGLQAQILEVAFVGSDSRLAQELARAGTEIMVPAPKAEPVITEVSAPGMDPDKPPILR